MEEITDKIKLDGWKQAEKPNYGLKDGGEIELNCQVCGKLLLTILITRPNFRFADGTILENNYKAKCYNCGNFSKSHHIKGGVATIHPSEINENGIEKVTCFIEKWETVDDEIIYIMKKYERKIQKSK